MKRNLLLGLCATIITLGASLTSCGSKEVDPLADGKLTIGLECAYSPFNYTTPVEGENTAPISNATGEYCGGYDILIAKQICADLNVELEVVRCDWDGLIPSLTTGTIDAIIAGMTDTEERRNSIDFTDEYYSSQLVIVTSNTNSSFTKIEDFAGLKFIAQTGTVQADLIDSLGDSGSESYAGIVAGTHTNTYPESFVALKAGTVDCVVCETPVANDFLANESNYTAVTLEGNDDFIVSVSIGISKNAVASYKEALNGSLKKISQDMRTQFMNAITGE